MRRTNSLKLFCKYYWMLEEAAFLTTLAIPPAIVCLTEALQMKMSNIFIGRASGNNVEKMLSALFLGQVVTSCTSAPISDGISIYVNVLCSQAYGAKQYKLVGLYFYRALFMAALTLFPLSALFISIRPIVYSITQDWELAYHAGSYTTVFCLGYPACVYFKAALSFLQAQNIVWPPLIYLILGNIVNGVLQYVLIAKYETNLAGAAAGYVISMYVTAMLFYAHIRITKVHLTTYVEFSVKIIREWYNSMKYIIFPTSQSLIGFISATLLPLIILGAILHDTEQVAIYSVLFSIWYTFSLIVVGFSSAITVRVGNLLGSQESNRARRAALFSIFYCEIYILILAVLLFFIAHPLSYLFTTDSEFAMKLEFSIRAICFILPTDVSHFAQGIMNACCMQIIQSAVKFITIFILGSILMTIISNFVWWKAVSILLSYGICNVLAFITSLVIILCRNWTTILQKVKENTDRAEKNEINACIMMHSYMCHFEWKCCETKLFQHVRYCSSFLLGFMLFIAAVTCSLE